MNRYDVIDFVSDRRADPTAAAEMAVPVRLDLLGWTEEQGGGSREPCRMEFDALSKA